MYQNQNYGYYNPQMPARQMPLAAGLKGRPVSSLDEVRATGIDFDGSIFYFPDIANKRIYTKQINLDGSAQLNMYELVQTPIQNEAPQIDTSRYITREEFEQALIALKNSMTVLVPDTAPAVANPASTPLPAINF